MALTFTLYPDNKIIGTLDKKGAITISLENKTITFPFPSGAARAITKTSVNCWKYWRILENGKYHEISYFKEKYQQIGSQRLESCTFIVASANAAPKL